MFDVARTKLNCILTKYVMEYVTDLLSSHFFFLSFHSTLCHFVSLQEQETNYNIANSAIIISKIIRHVKVKKFVSSC